MKEATDIIENEIRKRIALIEQLEKELEELDALLSKQATTELAVAA